MQNRGKVGIKLWQKRGVFVILTYLDNQEVYQISDIKHESTIGGRGRQLIFQKGKVSMYAYFKNYEEAIRCIDKRKALKK